MPTRFITFALFALFALSCGDGGTNGPANGDGINWRSVMPGDVPLHRTLANRTPLGISVYNDTPLTAAELEALDNAYLHESTRAAAEGNYSVFPNPAVIDVFFPKSGCVPSPVQQIPSFKLRYGDEYDGTIYDTHYSKAYNPPRMEGGLELHSEKDGVAVGYAAEMVTGMSTPGSFPPRDSFVLCKELIYEGMRAGLNHIFIAHNDGPYYTNTIGPNHQHPIPYRPLGGVK